MGEPIIDSKESVIDLVTNLRHWLALQPEMPLTFDDLARISLDHFTEERREAGLDVV